MAATKQRPGIVSAYKPQPLATTEEETQQKQPSLVSGLASVGAKRPVAGASVGGVMGDGKAGPRPTASALPVDPFAPAPVQPIGKIQSPFTPLTPEREGRVTDVGTVPGRLPPLPNGVPPGSAFADPTIDWARTRSDAIGDNIRDQLPQTGGIRRGSGEPIGGLGPLPPNWGAGMPSGSHPQAIPQQTPADLGPIWGRGSAKEGPAPGPLYPPLPAPAWDEPVIQPGTGPAPTGPAPQPTTRAPAVASSEGFTPEVPDPYMGQLLLRSQGSGPAPVEYQSFLTPYLDSETNRIGTSRASIWSPVGLAQKG